MIPNPGPAEPRLFQTLRHRWTVRKADVLQRHLVLTLTKGSPPLSSAHKGISANKLRTRESIATGVDMDWHVTLQNINNTTMPDGFGELRLDSPTYGIHHTSPKTVFIVPSDEPSCWHPPIQTTSDQLFHTMPASLLLPGG